MNILGQANRLLYICIHLDLFFFFCLLTITVVIVDITKLLLLQQQQQPAGDARIDTLYCLMLETNDIAPQNSQICRIAHQKQCLRLYDHDNSAECSYPAFFSTVQSTQCTTCLMFTPVHSLAIRSAVGYNM